MERPSLTGARWAVPEVGSGRIDALCGATGLSRPAAAVLALRWDGSGEREAARWLEPSVELLHDPYSMLHMESAVDRLQSAIRRREKIRVVTDYDVDGTTSSLVLQAALRSLDPSVEVSYHIPTRFDEGYGFSVRAATDAARDGIGLIVTADIGVRDHAAVAAAREAGVDVLICDHHLPTGAQVPEGATVLCPPQDGDSYPNRALAACGVSLKLAQALLQSHPKRDAIVRSMLKLAAIGTVADMVSLGTLENRSIVSLGLAELNEGQHSPGLRELLRVCGLTRGNLDETSLGFRIGPRINAAGRVADAALVIQLLGTRDEAAAIQLAERLDELNTARRDLQRRIVAEALARLPDPPPPFVVLAGEETAGWHRGVVGIAASRIKDHVNRPVAVISIQGEFAVGSVRTIPAIHAVRALESVSDLLVKFGGHPAAAGFTVRTSEIERMAERLSDYVSKTVPSSEFVPVRRADVVVTAEQLTDRLHLELTKLGPFGSGNPAPALIIPNVRPFGIQVKGAESTILKFQIAREGHRAVDVLWWDGGGLAGSVQQQGPVDLLGALSENVWQGERKLQLEIRDARPAESVPLKAVAS
jgi:single-stranded-DNA-specific exonuclease